MSDETGDRPVFVTLVRNPEEIPQTHLLISSIRSFGGPLSQCPIWVYEANPKKASCDSLRDVNVQIRSLKLPDSIRKYLFGDKVFAGCHAEEKVNPKVRSLIWIDPSCFIVHPPLLYDLNMQFDAAVRPVHIQNVGLSASAPLDGFWKKVYETSGGVSDIQTTVETFVDRQSIRSYFNSHVFVINPSIGVLRRWFVDFEALVNDQEFQMECCQDLQHRIFLHQAVLSTLIAATIDPKRVRILPPEYNYPYNLHESISPERRATALNDVVSLTYEGRSLAPGLVEDIDIDAPLKKWLSDHQIFV